MQGNSQDVVLLWGSYRKECVRERERDLEKSTGT